MVLYEINKHKCLQFPNGENVRMSLIHHRESVNISCEPRGVVVLVHMVVG